MQCRNPPRGLRGDAMRRWILREITGRAAHGPLTDADVMTLASGRYLDVTTGIETRFGLPDIDEEATPTPSAGA